MSDDYSSSMEIRNQQELDENDSLSPKSEDQNLQPSN